MGKIDTSPLGSISVLPPRSTDDEASLILDELSKLQIWCVLQASNDRHAIAAADLVQRTRILIIQRCKRPAPAALDREGRG